MKKIHRICKICGEGKWISDNGRVSEICCACIQKTPEMRAKRRSNGLGRKHTEATKQKIRILLTGRFCGNNNHWKGGRYNEKGYVFVKLSPDDFFYPMANHQGYVTEHRLVVAKALGRCLQSWEIVHHTNHIRDDNRYPENLQLVTSDKHKQVTILEERVKRLESKVDEQTKLIKLLQWQLKEHEVNNNINLCQNSPSMGR